MYKTFFNFSRKPFDLLPDPEFLFLGKSHRKARLFIEHAIRERAGFVLLSGEIGAGKTTIIRDLIKNCEDGIVLAKIFNTRINPEQLLFMVNDDFGLPVESADKMLLLRDLNDFLIKQYAQGKKPLLIIDEAQNLSSETLEEVRLLSNLETDNAKLLQILLVGQPELRKIVALPELTQLRQRINLYCHILPLEQDELREYILYRMEVAGNREAVIFSPEALQVIWENSRGIPRLINIICDFILLFAFTEGDAVISAELAEEVVRELDFVDNYWGSPLPDAESAARSPTIAANNIDYTIHEIRTRIETIENRNEVNAYLLESARKRIDYFDHVLRDFMVETELKREDFDNK